MTSFQEGMGRGHSTYDAHLTLRHAVCPKSLDQLFGLVAIRQKRDLNKSLFDKKIHKSNIAQDRQVLPTFHPKTSPQNLAAEKRNRQLQSPKHNSNMMMMMTMMHSDCNVAIQTQSSSEDMRVSRWRRDDSSPRSRRPRKVQFAECANRSYHPPKNQLLDYDISQQWYTRDDYAAFKQDTHRQIVNLRSASVLSTDDATSLGRSLRRIYLAFQQSLSIDEMAKTLDSVSIRLDEHVIGLVDHLDPLFHRDYHTKRQRMLKMLKSMKCFEFGDEAIRREACRASRVSRVFARYVGFMSADALVNEQ